MIPENSIICFKQDTKERKRYFKAASFAHPAKMVLGLQIYLIEHYTKPGDVILDPMAGSGTILIACTLGRNVVLVELEDKFVKMQQDNYEKIKSLGPMLGYQMGEATILQGDARNLGVLLADNILFSPPYAESQITKDVEFEREKYIRIGRNPDGYAAKQSSHHPDNPKNISNLPYGEISAVISSPPYAETTHHSDDPMELYKYEHNSNRKSRVAGTAGENPNNIGNLKYGKADAILTSPPYEDKESFVDKTFKPPHDTTELHKCEYAPNNDNIGNLKSENYLEAMLQVYRQCHRVLKEKGLMVLVVKNFIRDKKIIRLDLDTIKICEKAGFKLKETLKRKLTQQSFWRTIYHNKYPDVEKIEYEDVLIFQKAE